MLQKPYDLPLICPTRQQVQFLLDATIQNELQFMKLTMQNHNHVDENGGIGQANNHTTTKTTTVTSIALKQILEEFEKDYTNKKFCTVNATEILNDKDWKQFLLSLWHPKRGKKPIDWDTSTYTVTLSNYSKVKSA